jgi:hypothetical protein
MPMGIYDKNAYGLLLISHYFAVDDQWMKFLDMRFN